MLWLVLNRSEHVCVKTNAHVCCQGYVRLIIEYGHAEANAEVHFQGYVRLITEHVHAEANAHAYVHVHVRSIIEQCCVLENFNNEEGRKNYKPRPVCVEIFVVSVALWPLRIMHFVHTKNLCVYIFRKAVQVTCVSLITLTDFSWYWRRSFSVCGGI